MPDYSPSYENYNQWEDPYTPSSGPYSSATAPVSSDPAQPIDPNPFARLNSTPWTGGALDQPPLPVPPGATPPQTGAVASLAPTSSPWDRLGPAQMSGDAPSGGSTSGSSSPWDRLGPAQMGPTGSGGFGPTGPTYGDTGAEVPNFPPTELGVGSVPPYGPPNSEPGGGANGAPTWQDVVSVINQPPTLTPTQLAYQNALQQFLGQAQQTPSLTDANLAPQVEQYRVQQQRNQERNRAAAVQRASTSGQNNSGYLDNAILRGIEEQGFNEAGFNANLLSKQYDKQREDLLAGMQLASATGNQEAQRELETRLAAVNAAMQQQGMNSQNALGWGGLSLQQQLGLLQNQLGWGQLDSQHQLGLLQNALGWGNLDLGWGQLDSQDALGWGGLSLQEWLGGLHNNQFYDSLGVNAALGLEGLNQSALQQILNALGK